MSDLRYILSSNEDLTSIFIPLKSTQRIKYTCFDISVNYLLFGATSGGIYLFNRSPCTFIQLIPNKDGSIVQLAISPDEKLIGFATVKGTVVIVERNSTVPHKRIYHCTEHQGNQITALHWSINNNEMFIGDDKGRVSVIHVSLFLGANMFQTPWYQLMELDSRIIQLDLYKEYLLISTMARSYLCNTNKEEYKQIGHKLREGEFGSCFLNMDYGIRIYCSRPGGRLWEVDFEGSVQSTYQFKPTLITTTPTVIHDILNREIFKQTETIEAKNCNFIKLLTILSKYIITYNSDGLYILDTTSSEVLLWNCQLKNIQDIRVIDDSFYIQLTTTGMLYKINLLDLEQFLVFLYLSKHYEFCIENLEKYQQYINDQIEEFNKLHIISDIKQKTSSNITISKEIEDILLKLTSIYENRKQKKLQTTSGIVVVENLHHYKSTSSSSTGSSTSPSIDWKPVIDSFSDDAPTKLFDQLLQITSNQQEIVNFNDYFSQKQMATMREIITKAFRSKWIIKNYFHNSENVDDDISKFLYKLLTLLDLKTILDDLVGLELNTFFHSTWSILNGIKNITDLTTEPPSSKTLPHRLNIAYCLLESEQIDSFIQYTQGINLKLIFYLFLNLMEQLKNKSALFLTYLDKSDPAVINVLKDKEMSDYFIYIFLKYYQQAGLSCECSYPLINKDHKEEINLHEIRRRQRLGSLLLNHRRDKADEICATIPSLWPNYILLQRSEPVDKVLAIIVQLGNWSCIEPWLMRMNLLDWNKLLSLQSDCQHRCLGCHRAQAPDNCGHVYGLPWSQIGIALIKHVGSKDALHLITKYQDIIPSNELNAKFYQSLLLGALVEKKESGLRDVLLDIIIKGGKNPLFSHQIMNDVNDALQADIHLQLPKEENDKASSTDNDRSLVGDAWGVHLDLNAMQCPVCSLSLDSRGALEESGGLTIFQCGHSFHTLCFNRASKTIALNNGNNSSSHSCPLCYQSALGNL